MCGICGVVQIGGEPRPVVAPDVLDRMTDAMTHRGPDDRGTYVARRRRARRAPAQHRRRRGRPPAVLRTRTARSGRSRTASSTTTLDLRARPRAGRPPLPEPLRHGDPPAPLRAARRRRSRSGCAASSRSPSGTSASAARCSRATGSAIKPLYYADCRRPARLRLRAQEPARERARRRRARLRGDRRLPDARLLPGPRTPLAQVSKLLPGHRLVVEDGGVRDRAVLALPRAGARVAGRAEPRSTPSCCSSSSRSPSGCG